MPDSSTWFSPAASQGPISSRSVSENRLSGTLTMPRSADAAVADGAVGRDAERAEVGGAPVDADHVDFPPHPSSEASRAALPPAAAVLIDTTRSSANRYSVIGPPAFGPVPDRPRPPNGCTPTTAPIWLRLT